MSIPSAGAKSSEAELSENTLIVVLGASGDLAKKKTFPALYGLYKKDFLPEGIHIVGYARTKMTEDEFHEREVSHLKNAVPVNPKSSIESFKKISTYVSGQYDSAEDFQKLNKHLEEIESKYTKGDDKNRVFYMALPPSVFTTVAEQIKKNCYTKNGQNRIIVEKPFGKDLQSSRDMMNELKKIWTEDEIFRIDHYLGKEMVKNLLILRFANPMIDASFNKSLISNVQITFKEPFGTEGRGGYFDEFGIIRDIMQNHLMQILTILTMERPVSFAAEDVRDEKVKVLRAIPPVDPKESLLGQYSAADGKPGYKDDDTVPKDSVSPTFAAVVLHINNQRWEGVPFIFKAGKALNEQKTEIRIQYKDVTQGIFKDMARNELVIRVQPGEAVYLKMNTKAPGLEMRSVPTEMDLTYKRRFSDLNIPEAYEALLLDAFKGDHSNFVRDDELDYAWRIWTPLLHYIENEKPTPVSYPYGSRGPKELNDFVRQNAGYSRTDQEDYQWPVTNLGKI